MLVAIFLQFQTNNVLGGAAGLEYWFDDNIRVFANYSYDNYQHSNVVGGLGISFGGVRKHWADPTLSERLMDPVDRYLANLGHGSGIPSKTLFQTNRVASQTLLNNIAFFSQTGNPNTRGNLSIANCTFENPCGPNDFTQVGVNSLNPVLPNTMFYFNGGTYPANNGPDPITLNNGQSVFSRTTDYSAAVTGTARSTFNGGFILEGNNQINDVIFHYIPGLAEEAIFSNGGQNIQLNNIRIGDGVTPPYPVAIKLINGAVATMNQSVVFSVRAINLNNSSFDVQSSNIVVGNGMDNSVLGFDLLGSKLVFDNSLLLVFADVPDETIGIFADNVSTASINNSDIIVQSISSPTPNNAIGLEAMASQIQMNGGNLSVSGDNTSVLTSGSNIALNGVVCILSGTISCS